VATTNQTAVATAHAPKSQRGQTVIIELIGLRASLPQCCACRSTEPSAQILKLPLRCGFDRDARQAVSHASHTLGRVTM